MDKQEMYSKLLAGAQAVGFNNPKGWTAHQYKNYFGVWPRLLNDQKIDEKFYNWLKTLDRNRARKIVFSLVK